MADILILFSFFSFIDFPERFGTRKKTGVMILSRLSLLLQPFSSTMKLYYRSRFTINS